MNCFGLLSPYHLMQMIKSLIVIYHTESCCVWVSSAALECVNKYPRFHWNSFETPVNHWTTALFIDLIFLKPSPENAVHSFKEKNPKKQQKSVIWHMVSISWSRQVRILLDGINLKIIAYLAKKILVFLSFFKKEKPKAFP